jgi:hypothetical protein
MATTRNINFYLCRDILFVPCLGAPILKHKMPPKSKGRSERTVATNTKMAHVWRARLSMTVTKLEFHYKEGPKGAPVVSWIKRNVPDIKQLNPGLPIMYRSWFDTVLPKSYVRAEFKYAPREHREKLIYVEDFTEDQITAAIKTLHDHGAQHLGPFPAPLETIFNSALPETRSIWQTYETSEDIEPVHAEWVPPEKMKEVEEEIMSKPLVPTARWLYYQEELKKELAEREQVQEEFDKLKQGDLLNYLD